MNPTRDYRLSPAVLATADGWIAHSLLVKDEDAAFTEQRLREHLGGIDRCKRFACAQVAFTVREQPPAGIRDRGVVADGSERVLQGASSSHMHMDIADRH